MATKSDVLEVVTFTSRTNRAYVKLQTLGGYFGTRIARDNQVLVAFCSSYSAMEEVRQAFSSIEGATLSESSQIWAVGTEWNMTTAAVEKNNDIVVSIRTASGGLWSQYTFAYLRSSIESEEAVLTHGIQLLELQARQGQPGK